MDSFLSDPPIESQRRFSLAREWIIFAICMGVGGHVVLGIVLHAPEAWPWDQGGRYAVLVGVFAYVAVLISRVAVRLIRTPRSVRERCRSWGRLGA
jgi:hypothetical protein